jgi:ABC-type iron transport system FetAB ATPase subunit
LRVEELCFRDWGPITLAIDSGECVCLSGPSGSGKTLLLRAVTDLDPHEGESYVDDVACSSVSGPAWRRIVGLLPAESQWWHDSVGPHFADLEARWLPMLGFREETMSWTVQRLSTGEKQRLGLLRLLSRKPRALLLDEPTASLDPEGVRRAEDVVAAYRQETGAPVLWVSHDPAQIKRIASRHVQIRDGRLAEGARP